MIMCTSEHIEVNITLFFIFKVSSVQSFMLESVLCDPLAHHLISDRLPKLLSHQGSHVMLCASCGALILNALTKPSSPCMNQDLNLDLHLSRLDTERAELSLQSGVD